MARITLFRHGKAEDPSTTKADFDRVLAARGRRDSDRMGRFIRDDDMVPQLVIVSDALRTRETHHLASAHWPEIPVEFLASIYEASATTVINAIEASAADYEHVMIIGHNPGLVVLLHQLIDPDEAFPGMSYFPTCCIADVGFDVKRISDIGGESGKLLSMVRVRELESQ